MGANGTHQRFTGWCEELTGKATEIVLPVTIAGEMIVTLVVTTMEMIVAPVVITMEMIVLLATVAV